jgi:hypothetical protein
VCSDKIYAQLHEIMPVTTFYVNPFNSLDVSFVSEVINAIKKKKLKR